MNLSEFATALSLDEKKEVFDQQYNRGEVIGLLIRESSHNEDNGEEILRLLREGRDDYMKNWMDEFDAKDNSEEYHDNKERKSSIERAY